MNQIESKIPTELARFSREVCLHDWVVISIRPAPRVAGDQETTARPKTPEVTTLLAADFNGLVIQLSYFGMEEAPAFEKPVGSDVFAPHYPT